LKNKKRGQKTWGGGNAFSAGRVESREAGDWDPAKKKEKNGGKKTGVKELWVTERSSQNGKESGRNWVRGEK